jgi:hypothetical protein
MIYPVFALLGLLASPADADIYMHNPRGSNDRNCERNVNRNNGNRLFDSQNNNNGGYACARGVGDEDFQDEMGEKEFQDITGQKWTQSKRMYYYTGSVLPIEWTNQHGCGYNAKVECEIVIQYACEDTLDPKVANFWPYVTDKGDATSTFFNDQHFRSTTNIAAPRDGVPRDANDAATDTIPDTTDAATPDTKETRRYGMHESYDHYQVCQRTERNKGLYTADQNVRRNDRRGTRQNPNGNRNGLECPEERDYYPWWAPSPWVDIAVLSDQADDEEICNGASTVCSTRCLYYMDNTMNWSPKGYCDANHTATSGDTVATKTNSRAWQRREWYNNKDDCLTNGFSWYEVSHDDNIALDPEDFVCARTHFARTNQLGNAMGEVVSETDSSGVLGDHLVHGVNANRFIWQIPEIPEAPAGDAYFNSNHDGASAMESAYKSCTLRMRYNISTGDFQQWPEDSTDAGTAQMVDSRNNSQTLNDPNTPLEQDPYIYIGNDILREPSERFVSLAVNTNQYGRTFQDRSYSFSIKNLPSEAAATDNYADTFAYNKAAVEDNLSNGGKIYNVNVRGKRGNIVQVYPSVEYDFAPNALKLGSNDMIHFQWTGSDYNPRRGCNNGEGGPPDPNDYVSSANANFNSRADRSNLVFQDAMSKHTPKDYLGYELDADLTLEEKIALEKMAVLLNAPCYDPATDSANQDVKDTCYELMVRLSYLNQQKDLGALVMRQGMECLTEAELDELPLETAQNHPRNCAKINSKPWPYFDAGLMMLRNSGFFSFFSSRNNNFSNRDQKGVICIGDDTVCPTDQIGGISLLQQPPTYLSGTAKRSNKGVCIDTLNDPDGANANGATSCVTSVDDILEGETSVVQEGDNDNYGDGNLNGCSVLADRSFLSGTDTIEEQVALAIILFFVGLVFAWLAYYLYNRWKASHQEDGKFRGDKSWQGAGGFFEMINPFKKVPTEAVV